MSIRIQDTLSGDKREFVPVEEGKVGMYLCGMTVQDRPHIGHMRSAIVGDVIRRFFEHEGYDVTFVYNFTDVDDKIIAKANAEGIDYHDVSQRNIDAFEEVADRLNIRPATINPRATEHIRDILDMIQELVDGDLAYPKGGDVYFRVAKFKDYGKLSRRRIEDLESGARIEIGEDKEDPLDFTLWKGTKPGEPAWDSPWGPGRPGWHIECSAMSRRYLGKTFDIHAGGLDLVFPHHENEIAQSEGANAEPFANYWIHNAMVNLGGEKMSKSTQHFFLAEDVLAEVEPHVVRYYLMSTHHRSPIEFSRERLAEAGLAWRRLMNAVEAGEELRGSLDATPALGPIAEDIAKLRDGFMGAMRDDFNTARAIGYLFEMARAVNRAADGAVGDPALASGAVAATDELRRLAAILGLDLTPTEAEVSIPDEVEALFAERQAARAAKEWARADELRGKILEAGFQIEDRPDGSRLVPAS